MSTYFSRKNIHKITWRSPCGLDYYLNLVEVKQKINTETIKKFDIKLSNRFEALKGGNINTPTEVDVIEIIVTHSAQLRNNVPLRYVGEEKSVVDSVRIAFSREKKLKKNG